MSTISSRVGAGVAREQVVGRHQDPRRAEAALERVVAPERLLKRCERAVPREPLDRDDLCAVDLRGEQQARAHGDAVELHGARAADAVLAADVRPGEPELVAEEVGEEEPRLDVLAVAPAVDGHVDRDHAAPLPRAGDGAVDEHAVRAACRYAGEAWIEPHGSTCAAADSPGRVRIDLEHRRSVDDRPDDDPQLVAASTAAAMHEGVVAAALRELLERETLALAPLPARWSRRRARPARAPS